MKTINDFLNIEELLNYILEHLQASENNITNLQTEIEAINYNLENQARIVWTLAEQLANIGKVLPDLSSVITNTALTKVLAWNASDILNAVVLRNPMLDPTEVEVKNIHNLIIGGEADIVVKATSKVYAQGSVHVTFRVA